MHVAALYHYPIKSCRGHALAVAHVDHRGIRDDRRLMVVDQHGRFLTQREHPRMALITPQRDGDHLMLSAPDMPPITHLIDDGKPRIAINVWRFNGAAVDQGDDLARWLSTFLRTDCRLVSFAPEVARHVNQDFAPRPTDQIGFADGYPFLLISEASLADLNTRLAEPLPMDRFRPNIVVAGCAPYAEDTWRQLRIGPITFDLVKPCARCAITTTDQQTAARGKEPLRTLATYRAVNNNVMFGQNAVHDRDGILRVGDGVEVISAI